MAYVLFKNQDPIKLIEEIQKVDSKWVILSMMLWMDMEELYGKNPSKLGWFLSI